MTLKKRSVLSDLSTTVTRWKERSRLLEGGGPNDYTADEYRETAKRAVARLHPERMQLRVARLIDETPSARTLRFERTDAEIPPFRAGQYVNLFAVVGGVRTSRPYSIASAPGTGFLDLTIRIKENGFISPHLIRNVKVGDTFESTGPEGQFYFEPLIDRGDLVFLAGGSGITPFMGMVRHFARVGWPRQVCLIYGSRSTTDVIFKDELEGLAKAHPAFDYRLIISEPPAGYTGRTGFITENTLKDAVGVPADRTFFICGPNAMYDAVLPELDRFGVPRHKVRREAFGPPDDVTKLPGWPAGLKPSEEFTVKIMGKGSLKARAGEPLLNSLERAGHRLRCVCRSGKCSYCRTRLVSGKVFVPQQAEIRESDRARNFLHTCVSYPLEDLEIRL